MPQSLVNNLVHLVTSTKHRQPWISAEHRHALWAYKASMLENWNCCVVIIGGVEDHVHSLCSLSKNFALKKVVEEVKKGSSKWMKSDGPRVQDFHWPNGYAVFSVSQSNVEDVRQYIQNQAAHHRQMTFQDELRRMCQLNELKFDERYGWE